MYSLKMNVLKEKEAENQLCKNILKKLEIK